MAEGKDLLILRLEGAMQSWGEISKWDYRESADFPTKSAIVGLIACTMGLGREDPMIAKMGESIKIAIRADRPGIRTVDYQTVTGNPLRKADGKPRANGNTIVTRREYLQDACFTVFLEADDAWRTRIADALTDPKWAPYLGRKNCVPSRPVFVKATAEYSSLEEAVFRFPFAERAAGTMPYEIEHEHSALGSITRPDCRLQGNRRFTVRKVWRGALEGNADVLVKN